MSEIQKRQTISDLISVEDLEKAYKNDQLNVIFNQPPPAQWVKEHPYVKGHKYVPIDKVEYMLKRFFKTYNIEITGQGTAFNGVWVTVRITVKNPATNEIMIADGIGAAQMQTSKGTSPADLANINNGALSMAFPIAKTLAIKDAADHFGAIFGANLNRKDVLTYQEDNNLVSAFGNNKDKLK